jgi:hypothetical protein
LNAAEKLGRDWIGIDVTQLAISLIKNRRQDTYGSRMKFVSGSQSESGGARASRPPRSASSLNARSASENSNVREPSPAPDVIGETPMTATGTVALPNPTKTALPNQSAFPETSLVRIIGEPTTPNEAATLAEEDKFQFQWWTLGLVGARPVEQKKGADHGIDEKILFTLFRRGCAAARSAGGRVKKTGLNFGSARFLFGRAHPHFQLRLGIKPG